jgi:hypothetical protein
MMKLHAALAVVAVSALACDSGSGPAGTPVVGPPDNHCFVLPDGGLGPMTVQPTSMASCHPDAGPGFDGGTGTVDYGPTNYNSSAADDDCKYLVGFSSTPLEENTDVTLTVTAITTLDGTPLTGAQASAEIFLSSTHPAPNSDVKSVEGPAGVYTIGPVRFDAAGQWTVRFHFFQQCVDLNQDSPHGHAAFYVDIP